MDRLASKPPLITPSASPPTSHTFFPQPYRIPDQASPAKRPRLSSAPRQFQPHAPVSSSTTNPDQIDFQKAREASALRMLDVWSNLADRYSRPLDQDDIIDLNTGKVIKDRGVIRGSRNWELGCFADDVGDEAEEGDEDEDEDDIDELDSFALQESIDGHSSITEVDARNVPPVREMDPADAEDLKQFLEAERRRRETCGSEVEETESSVAESHDEGYHESQRSQKSGPPKHIDDSVRQQSATSDVFTSNDDATTPNPELNQTPLQRGATVFVDSGSDDELAGYDIDEASVVYRIPKKEEAQDSDSEVEFVEPPLALSRPKPQPKTAKRHSEPRPPQPVGPTRPNFALQLQTPPLSQTSSLILSATPSDDYYIELPPDSSSLPPSSPPSSYYSSPLKPPGHIQTQKPSEDCGPTSPLERGVPPPPIPRLDLTKLSKGRSLSKSKVSKNKLPSHTRSEASKSSSPTIVESKGVINKEPLTRPRMEVVINKRVPFQHHSPPHSSPIEHIHTTMAEKDSHRAHTPEDTRSIRKEKGKAKQPKDGPPVNNHGVPKDMAHSDDSIIILSSSPSPTANREVGPPSPRARKPEIKPSVIAPRSPKRKHEKPLSVKSQASAKPMPTPAIPNKKRKRVVSSSELEVVSLSDVTGLQPVEQHQSEATRRAPAPRHTRPSAPSSTENELAEVNDSGPKPRPKRKPTPKQRSRSSSSPRKSGYESDSSSRSSPERYPEHDHRYSRAHSHFSSMPPSDSMYYPYPQPPYPPHVYAPIPDPRAQYIITQAMHQLSALVGGPWTPPGSHHRGSTPFTPSHSRHQSRTSNLIYSTPIHHQHPYPYSFDADLSRGTLPPGSPEVQSSPAAAGTFTRRKSLVKRSRSRGRRVSFRIEEGIVDTIDISSSHTGHDEGDYSGRSPGSAPGHETTRQKKKGKEKAEPAEADPGEDVPPNRGRTFTRAQTPGPPIRGPSSESRPGRRSVIPPIETRGTSRSRLSQTR